jgi:hypothetical protein
MATYYIKYCQFDTPAGGLGTSNWKGFVANNCAHTCTSADITDGSTGLDYLTLQMWNDIKDTYGGVPAPIQLEKGLGMDSKSTWTAQDTNTTWLVNWQQWLPTTAAGGVGTQHGIRKLAGGTGTQLYEVNNGTVKFTQAHYTAAQAKLDAIMTGTIRYNESANLDRIMSVAHFSDDHTKLYWDATPPWLLGVDYDNSNTVRWTYDNATYTPTGGYSIYIFVQYGGNWYAHTSNPFSIGSGGAGTADITTGYSNTAAQICLGRTNDAFVYQTFLLPSIAV